MKLHTDVGPVAVECIQVAAYYQYQNRRKYGAEGNELGDWLKAEAEILGPSAQKPEIISESAKDLTAIKGIGKLLADRLGRAGWTKLEQVAAWTPADIDRVNASLQLRGRIRRDDWVAQAKALLA